MEKYQFIVTQEGTEYLLRNGVPIMLDGVRCPESARLDKGMRDQEIAVGNHVCYVAQREDAVANYTKVNAVYEVPADRVSTVEKEMVIGLRLRMRFNELYDGLVRLQREKYEKALSEAVADLNEQRKTDLAKTRVSIEKIVE